MSPKKKLFEQFARVAKSLASPNRLDLLETLAQGEKSVDALAQATGMSVANTSHHLQILRDSGLAESRKEGLQVIYRLSDDQIPTLMGCISRIAEKHLAEVERIVANTSTRAIRLPPWGVTSCWPGSSRARPWSSTCVPPWNTRPATSPAR